MLPSDLTCVPNKVAGECVYIYMKSLFEKTDNSFFENFQKLCFLLFDQVFIALVSCFLSYFFTPVKIPQLQFK